MGFLNAIKRRRLADKGMSSGKKRRTTSASESAVVDSMERSIWIKLLIYPVFIVLTCLIVASYKSEDVLFFDDEFRRMLICSILSLLTVFFFHIRHDLKIRNGKVVLVFGGILIHLVLLRAIFTFIQNNGLDLDYRLLLPPLAFIPMIHSVLLGRHAGLFSSLMMSLFGCMLMPLNDLFSFLVISLAVGGMAVALTRNVRRRSDLLRAGIYVGAVTLLLAVAFDKVQLCQLTTGEGLSIEGLKLVVALCGGIITGMVVSGLLPIIESIFKITTNISWLELSDLNHKLLRKLQLEAPGTYHHSMVVATLSESAAEIIGANAGMCRVSSYFHDIGKLKKPNYFIENQCEINPHDELTPTMSTLIIIAHVKDGVDMAIKHKLNPKIIEVIREHHGSSVMRYFYHKALEQRKEEEEKVEQGLENKEDLPVVDEKSFRYPGPCPSSRESGIISLADIVESASRSLKKPTPAKIQKMVRELVMDRVTSGQMDNSGLTLGEIKTICSSFSSTLNSMMHTRIDYPEEDAKAGRQKDESDGKVESEDSAPASSLEAKKVRAKEV